MTYIPRGAIALSASKTKLAGLIRWGQRTWGEPPSKVNHSLLIDEGGWWPPFFADPDPTGMAPVLPEPRIVESDKTVRRGTLAEYHALDKLVIFDIEMTEEERALVVADADKHTGRPYAVLQLFGQLIDNKLLFGRNVFRRLAKVDPLDICSHLTGDAFAKIGVTFGEPGYAQSPDDQDDFLRAAAARGRLGFRDDRGVWRGVRILHDDFVRERA